MLANHRGWASLTGAVDSERVAMLEEALDAVGPGDTSNRVRLLATLVAELTFDDDLDRRRAFASEAVAIARRLDDERALVAALIGQLSLPDRPGGESLSIADEAIELAIRLDDPVSLAIASASGMTSAISFADRERLDHYLSVCVAASTRVGQPELVWRSMGARALVAIINGDLAAAEALADEILPHATDMGFALLYYGSLVIAVRAQAGRGGEIRELLSAMASDTGGGSAADLARAGLLLAHLQAGDIETARAGLVDQAAHGFAAGDDQLWLTHICIDAHVCVRLGQLEHVETLLHLLEPFTDLVAATPAVCLFSAAACAGALAATLGHHDDADRFFQRAIDLTSTLDAPYLLASAQLEWARALLVARMPPDERRAADLLAPAIETAARYGFGEIEREGASLGRLITG